MKRNISNITAGLAVFAFAGLAQSTLQAQTVTVLQESFETDGQNDRYFVIGGGDNGELEFFARREEFSAGADASGGTIDGSWFWGASDIDNINEDLPSDLYPDLGNRDGVLIFNDIDISGIGDLRIEMAVAQGEGTFEPDNHFQIQIRFDSTEAGETFGTGDWITIGGFRAISTNTPARYFVGPLRITTESDPRLTSTFQDWAWDINGLGDTIDIRLVINSNFWEEDYYVDNIRIIGEEGLVFVNVTVPSADLTEPATSEPIDVTFTASEAAPAGGLTFDVLPDDWMPLTIPMPATVTIPEGQTSLTVTLDHLADNRFTGLKVAEAVFDSPEIARTNLIVNVTNTTPKPDVLVMEVLNVFPGAIESDLQGDANGDGARTYPGDLFVELVNFEEFPVDISGWVVEDDLGPRYQYPEGTILAPGRAIVTFGGGEPTGIFGGATVNIVGTSNGFAFNTTRAEIAGLFAPFGGEMEIVDLPFRSQILETTTKLPETDPAFGETASIHRTGDTRDAGFELHSLLSGAQGDNLFFSPGARIDGTPYFTPSNAVTVDLPSDTATEGDAPLTATITLSNPAPAGGLELYTSATREGEQVALSSNVVTVPEGSNTATFQVTPIDDINVDGPFEVSVFVNGPEGGEILGGFDIVTIEDNEANPFVFEIAEFLIDLNGTGADPNLNETLEEAVADQFIEIVNRSGFPVDLSGWGITIRVGSEFAIREPGHQFDASEFDNLYLQNDGAAVIFGEIFNSNKSNEVFAGAFVDDATNDDGAGGLHALAGDAVFVDLLNQFGLVIASLEIPAELTGQGQSVTLVNGTPTLHLEAAGGAFNLSSPGTQPDGTPYPGNGVWMPQEILGDIEEVFSQNNQTYARSASLDWFQVNFWPVVWSFSANGWWYHFQQVDSETHIFYDYASNGFFFIYGPFFPWAYSYTLEDWVVVTPGS